MPIDAAIALGATVPAFTSNWDHDAVILYHLGIGAGFQRPTDAAELAYTYEPGLAVLPSFAVVPAFLALVAAVMGQVPGLAVNPALVLHGEQDLEIHRPLPPEATVEHRGRISSLLDKGKAALVTLEVESGPPAAEPWFTNRFTLFARDEGGFAPADGRQPSAPPPANAAPDRPADAVAETPTMPHQALVYRLSGDRNPLHGYRTTGPDRVL